MTHPHHDDRATASMKPTLDDPRAPLRRAVYLLLIVASACVMVGRIMRVGRTVRTVNGYSRTPILSSNDLSRWCTIHALVDYGTYDIDQVMLFNPDAPYEKQQFNHWQPIDMVRHQGRDGREHYYSSKPPLFPTMLAGKYWLLRRVIGIDLENHTSYVVRIILITTNVLPLMLFLWLLSRLVERYGQTDWGRMLVMAAACWGTFLTTFAVTLNNHVPAAISVMIALYCTLAIWCDGKRHWLYFATAGLFAAFAAANELPALSFLAALGVGLLWIAPWRTLAAFTPAAALVVGAFFFTNYLGHESLRPPYMHRQDGKELLRLKLPLRDELNQGRIPDPLREELLKVDVPLPNRNVVMKLSPNRWMIYGEIPAESEGQDVGYRESKARQLRLAIVAEGETFHIRESGNWYHYELSYWISNQRDGLDLGEPSRAVYAFHILLGHHGIFSLTPIWLLSAAGLGMMIATNRHNMRWVAMAIVALSLVCIAFYIARPLLDRNYGGSTCGLRWLFWFTPLWLLAALPAADWLAGSRWGRAVSLIALGVSIFSASYTPLNPWSNPWLYDYWSYLGLIQY